MPELYINASVNADTAPIAVPNIAERTADLTIVDIGADT